MEQLPKTKKEIEARLAEIAKQKDKINKMSKDLARREEKFKEPIELEQEKVTASDTPEKILSETPENTDKEEESEDYTAQEKRATLIAKLREQYEKNAAIIEVAAEELAEIEARIAASKKGELKKPQSIEDIDKEIETLTVEIDAVYSDREKIVGKIRNTSFFEIFEKGKLRKRLDALNVIYLSKANLRDAKFKKRDELQEEIKNQTEKQKIEAEKQELENDRKNRPFLYFVAGKDNNPEMLEYEKGADADLRFATWMTSPENYGAQKKYLQETDTGEGYFVYNIYGFVMIIKNVEKIRDENGINAWSDRAVYKIVGPQGKTVAYDIQGYYPAREIYLAKTKEYQAILEEEFNNLKSNI